MSRSRTHPSRAEFQSRSLLTRAISSCARCPRLAAFLEEHRAANPDWWCRPVPGFGDPKARIVILGLAPGLKGANRTGRPFTGDAAGIWLYRILYERALCNQAKSESRTDGLGLRDAYIANVVKCVPPENKPKGAEVRNCGPLLVRELEMLKHAEIVICLGKVAHDAYLSVRRQADAGLRPRDLPFRHGAVYRLKGRPRVLVDSYHPSRQNTNTGRLTWEMWKQVYESALGAMEELLPRKRNQKP